MERQIEMEILAITEEKWIPYKGTNLLAISMDFRCNVSLPGWIGLGKGTSLGFGTVRRKGEVVSEVRHL